MNLVMHIRTALYLVMSGSMALAVVGCGHGDEAAEAPLAQPVEVSSPGGAPTFGKPSGMGLATGDALNSTGQGSGYMGYNNTGAAGTAGAISDTHHLPPPPPAKDPVLPPA